MELFGRRSRLSNNEAAMKPSMLFVAPFVGHFGQLGLSDRHFDTFLPFLASPDAGRHSEKENRGH
jgi:hypothetical protein